MFRKKRKHLALTLAMVFLLSIFVPVAMADNNDQGLPDGVLIFGGVCEGVSTDFLFDDRPGVAGKINEFLAEAAYDGDVYVQLAGQPLFNVWERREATADEEAALLACFTGYWQDAETFVPFVPVELEDIVDTAIAADDFDTLVAAVVEAGLEGALRAPGPFTVFAPTDAAFAALLDALGILPGDLLASEDLVDILLYHVLAGEFLAADVIALAPFEAETLLGKNVSVTVEDGNVFVNDAQVIIPDIRCSNGVIHAIDAVLAPPLVFEGIEAWRNARDVALYFNYLADVKAGENLESSDFLVKINGKTVLATVVDSPDGSADYFDIRLGLGDEPQPGDTVQVTIKASGAEKLVSYLGGSLCKELLTQEFVIPYELTVVIDPAGSGTVEGLEDSYYEGDLVDVTAVAAVGYKFLEWTATAGSFDDPSAASTTFNMPAEDVTVTASFEEVDPPTNLGFEDGDFTGWTLTGPAGKFAVVTSYTSSGGTEFGPKEGSYFATVTAGGLGEGVYNFLSQDLSLSAGQTVSGWAAFDARDSLSFNDDAVVIMVNAGTQTIWQRSISDVGGGGESGWSTWSWTAPAAGVYTLQLGCRNVGDDWVDSVGLFDGIRIN